RAGLCARHRVRLGPLDEPADAGARLRVLVLLGPRGTVPPSLTTLAVVIPTRVRFRHQLLQVARPHKSRRHVSQRLGDEWSPLRGDVPALSRVDTQPPEPSSVMIASATAERSSGVIRSPFTKACDHRPSAASCAMK